MAFSFVNVQNFAVLVYFLNFFLSASAKPGDSVIYSVFPNRGSLYGGTVVTILGASFRRENISGVTLVYIGNMPCPVDYYKSSDSQRGVGSLESLSFAGYLKAIYGSAVNVKLGDFHCVVADNLTLGSNLGGYDFSVANCTMPLLTAGYFNISLDVQDSTVGFGAAQNDNYMSIGTNTSYMLQVYPKISSVSTSVSGVNGGQSLIITGSGFSSSLCSDNFVLLQGVPCAVQKCTQTSLACTIGHAPNVTLGLPPYAATRGLFHRIYWNSGSFSMNSFITNANYPNSPSMTRVQAESLNGYCVNCADFYGQQLEGFFVPKVTAFHKFYIYSDDESDLYLSADNQPSNMTRIAYCSGYCPTYWIVGTQISAPIYLQAGKPYFIRARQSEGNGGDYLTVAVRVINPPARSLVEQAMHSVHEQQRMSITTTVRREIQRLNFTSANGKFMFYVSDFGARSAQVNLSSTDTSLVTSAVKAVFTACGSISVSRTVLKSGALIMYDISINCPTLVPYSQIKVDTTGMTGSIAWQRVQSASVPIRGTYQIGYNGSWTQPLNWNDGISTVQQYLLGLGSIYAVAVTQSSYSDFGDGFSMIIDISSPVGDLPTLLLNTSLLTGDAVQGALSIVENGSADAFYSPIPGDMLYFPTYDVQSISLTVNGISAVCDDVSLNKSACGFSYSAAVTPIVNTITTLRPGAVLFGDNMSITGAHFGTNPLTVTVAVGQGSCFIKFLSDNLIVCTVGHLPVGPFSLSVLHASLGFANINPSQSNAFNYSSYINSISPLSGAPEGGNSLLVTGTGFTPLVNIFVGSRLCATTMINASHLYCTVPRASENLSNVYFADGIDMVANITVSAFANLTQATYLYTWAKQPVVSQISPSNFSAGVTTLLQLSGNFTLHQPNNESNCLLSVSFGGCQCANPKLDGSVITCAMTRGCVLSTAQQAAVRPQVVLCGSDGQQVWAHADPGVQIDLALRVTRISVSNGSIAGGTELHIYGAGFILNRRNRLSVSIVDQSNQSVAKSLPCTVSDSTYTSIACNISALSQIDTLSFLSGVVQVSINDIIATCDDCSFTINANSTPTIANMSVSSGLAGDTIVFPGSGLSPTLTHVMLGSYYCAPSMYWISNMNSTLDGSEYHCIVPALPAGVYQVIVHVDGLGFALHLCSHLMFTSLLRLDSISPTSGSLGGGTNVVLAGAGFSNSIGNNAITFGTVFQSAFIVKSNYTHIECITPLTPTSVTTATVARVSVRVLSLNYANDSATDASACYNSSICQFTYTPALTPQIVSVTPTSGFAGTVLRISGSSFGAYQSGTTVVIGGVACIINSANYTNNQINCTLGESPGGASLIYVTIPGLGTARVTATFTSLMKISNFTPNFGGFGGGQTVDVFGFGFGTGAGGSLVYLCNSPCTVITSSYNALRCITSSIATTESLYAFNTYDRLKLAGTAIAGSAAFDGDYGTAINSCPATFDMGPSAQGMLTRINFFPATSSFALTSGGLFETSVNGSVWSTVAIISTPRAGWNSIDLAPWTQPVRYIRYRNPVSCRMLELEFIGVMLAVTDSSDAPSACRLNVSVTSPENHPCHGVQVTVQTTTVVDTHDTGGMGVMHMMPGMQDMLQISTNLVVVPTIAASVISDANKSFTFSASRTPIVNSVSPPWGTALGGTSITITGVNLPTSLNSTFVDVSGDSCMVTSLSSDGTWVTCITSARTAIRPASLNVGSRNSDGNPVVYCMCNSSVRFEYLDRWSDFTTWGNEELPIEGDTVIIPEDQRVLLDISPPRLFVLLVQGWLIFDRKDLALNATYIFIPGGKLQVGTETEPFLQKATITLHGDRFETIELPHIGSKVLAVSNKNLMLHSGSGVAGSEVGMLDLHGKPRIRTWTKVAQDAPAGTDTIVTAEDVDYEAGDKIVLTSGRSYSETEEMTVVSLDADNRTLHVFPSLKFTHESRIVYVEGRRVDMRCEVGLLSRNVIVQGGDESAPQLFGVHTMAVHGGIYRIENTEVRQCGQAFNLGRYCIHYHMAGEERHCYARSNSIHNSFQRAVTIHGTNNLRVQHNFAYHVMGHNFFVEDGAERYNYIEENLGVLTLPSSSLLKSDTKPATFWTSSPTNYWRHNVAAGSTHDGYWFELPGNPGGGSFTTSICPVGEHIGEFYNNTAHSNGVHGLRVYPVYLPHVDPCNENSGPAPQYYYNFTSFHNGQHGIFGKRNGDLHHVNAQLLENGGDEFFLIKYEMVAFTNDPFLSNVLAVGSLGSIANNKHAITAPQNEFFYVSGATLVNYGSSGALAGCAECDMDTEFRQGAYTVRFDGLRFVNVSVRTHWNAPYKDIFIDLDGTLTGSANSTVTPYFAFNNWPECPRAGAMYEQGLICNSSVQVRRLQIDGVNPRELDFQVFQLQSAAGNSTVRFRPKESYGWVVPVVNTHNYKASFISLVDWQSMRIRYSEPEYVLPGEWMQLSFNYTDYRYQFAVTYSDTTATVPAFPDQTYSLVPSQSFGTSLINILNKSFDVILATGSGVDMSRPRFPGPYSFVATPVQCAPNSITCGFVGDVPLQYPPRLWSLASSWDGNGVPACDADVVIPPGVIMQLDINPCKLKSLLVYGKLQFVDSSDRLLQVDSITVFGYLEVGLPAAPFKRNARIVVNGIRSSPTVIVSDSIFLGNKVIAAFGRIDLWGKARITPWTRLNSTVNAGSNCLQLVSPVDWVSGDSIAITSTEYDATQTENLTVLSVSADAMTVCLTTPVLFRHFAGNVDDGLGNKIPLAAAVGVLTRNIVIEGALTSASDVYGAHVYVGDILYPNGKRKVGSFQANGVEFRNTGKQGMQYPSIMFAYTTLTSDSTQWPSNAINGSSFSFSLNYGIVSQGSRGINVTYNVFHRTYRTAVDLDTLTQAATITNNLVVGNFKSPDDPFDWIRPFAGFYIDTTNILALKDNLVGGTEDSGFVFRPDSCAISSARISGNEVHGALIGAFLLPMRSGGCVQLINFVAWKCAHIAVLTVDQMAQVLIKNITVSDSHMGISLNYLQNGNAGRSDVVNSRIFGSTAASTCGGSLTCRAQTKNDVYGQTCGSVFGSGTRRIGLVLPQYLNRAKTCDIDGGLPVCRPPTTPERLCSMPWELRYGLPGNSIHAEIYVTNTVFGYFNNTDCGMQSTAIALNPSQIDYSPHLFLSGIAWTAVSPAARMSLGVTPLHPTSCQTSCDAVSFAMATDLDGTVVSGGGTLTSDANPLLASAFPLCTPLPSSGAIRCPTTSVFQAMMENNDLDRGGRLIGPVRVTKLTAADNRTVWARGPFDDQCAKRFFFGQYPFALEAGQTYYIMTTGTMPSNSRFQFFSKSSSAVVLLRIFYTKPYSISVYNDGVQVPASLSYPTLSSPRGANILDPQRRELLLVMRGSAVASQQIYDLVTENNVQLTLTLKISEVDFFGATLVANLALLLQIPASRIRIVSVHAAGSRRRLLQATASGINVNVEIAPAVSTASVASNSTALSQSIAAQQTLMNQIAAVASSGVLKSTLAANGIPLASMTITPPPGVGAESSATYAVSVDASSSSSSGPSIVPIAAGAAGGVALLGVLFLLWAKKNNKFMFNRSTADSQTLRTGSPPRTPVLNIRPAPFETIIELGADADSTRNLSAGSLTLRSTLDLPKFDDCVTETNFPSTPRLSPRSSPFPSPRSPHRQIKSSFELVSQEGFETAEHVNIGSAGALATGTSLRPVWSQPGMTRDSVTKLLIHERVGSFAVYGSSSCTLAVRLQKAIHHFAIVSVLSDPPRFRLALTDDQPWLENIIRLVEYYQTPRKSIPFVLVRDSLIRNEDHRDSAPQYSTQPHRSEATAAADFGLLRQDSTMSKRTEEDLNTFQTLTLQQDNV